jgi:hypothetical protein
MTPANNAGVWRTVRAYLTPNPHSVHFHIDAEGRAFVCDASGCDGAALTLREAALTDTGARRRIA